MRKILFAALLVAGTTLGFAKEFKQEKITPMITIIDSVSKTDTEKFIIKKSELIGSIMHVEGFVVAYDKDGNLNMYYYDFYIWVP